MPFYDTRMEPSKRPREEYYAWSWRIQIDLHPDGNKWVWMIDEEENRGTYWHETSSKPTFEEIKQWIAAQTWSGEDTSA